LKNRAFLCLAAAMLIILAGGIFSGPIVNARAEANVSVVLDGRLLTFDVQPQILNDRTMLPFRAIAEAMGAEVNWDPDLRQISMFLMDRYAIMVVNDPVLIYGEFTEDNFSVPENVGMLEYVMDSPPVIVNDRTLVPVRAISEALGAEVDWDPETFTVYIFSPPEPAPEDTPKEGTESDEEPGREPEEPASPLLPTDIYDLENISITVDSGNPRRAKVTLKGIDIPKSMNTVNENGTLTPFFSIQFSSDGETVFGVKSVVPQGVSGMISINELDHYLFREISGNSVNLTHAAPRLAEVTGSSVTWEIEIPGNESIDMNSLTYLSYKAEFYIDIARNSSANAYTISDNEWTLVGNAD